MKLADPAHVAAQYRDSARFDARVRIYALYDTSPEPWLRWLFERLALAPGERVLEIGCGTGNLWRENAERVPDGVRLTLTDLSRGMLDESRARLADLALAIELREADAQSLPFDDTSFDLVVANHMLYHVPDRARALAEVRRVLRPAGRFVAGTNHWTHLLELRELLTRFGVATSLLPALRDPEGFDLETAAEEISAYLEISGVERRARKLDLAPLRAHVARQIARMKSFHVGIAAGVVRAVRS